MFKYLYLKKLLIPDSFMFFLIIYNMIYNRLYMICNQLLLKYPLFVKTNETKF